MKTGKKKDDIAPVRCSAWLGGTVENAQTHNVGFVVEEDRPHAVAYLIVRGWIVLAVMNTRPHQMPKYVLGWVRTHHCHHALEIAEADRLASQARRLGVRLLRAWSELLGAASLGTVRSLRAQGGRIRELISRLGMFLRLSCGNSVVPPNVESSATRLTGRVACN